MKGKTIPVIGKSPTAPPKFIAVWINTQEPSPTNINFLNSLLVEIAKP